MKQLKIVGFAGIVVCLNVTPGFALSQSIVREVNYFSFDRSNTVKLAQAQQEKSKIDFLSQKH